MSAPEFGDLRSLMNQARSARVWDQVCAWAESFDDATWNNRVLPYLEGHLSSWPERERMVPRRWIEAMLGEQPVPRMALARHLSVARWHGLSRSWRRETLRPTLLTHTALTHITCLNLSYNDLDEGFLALWKTCSHAGHVRELDLSNLKLGERTEPSWWTTQSWPAVEVLCLRENGLEDRLLHALAEGGAFSERPDTLDLFHNDLSSEGVRALSSSTRWRRLRTLDLGRNRLGRAGVEALVFPELRALRLERCELGDAEAEALATSSHLSGLRELKLWGNHLSDDGVRALAGSPELRDLEVLNLGRNDLSDAGAQALAESPYLTNLRELNLFGNRIGSPGAKALAAAPSLEGLQALRLGNNPITPAGQEALAQSPYLSEDVRGSLGV